MNIIPYAPGMQITMPRFRTADIGSLLTIDWRPTIYTFGVFVAGMPESVYHSMPGVSNSGLNWVNRSLAHYAARDEFQSTRAMEIGTAFHTALLEPQRFKDEYMILEGIDVRTKSEYKQAAKARGADKVLTEPEGKKVKVMLGAVINNPDAMEVLDKEGHAELSAFAVDPETGVMIRCRYDWITTEEPESLDIKKTQDARERAFSRSIHAYRYYCQDAMYSHIFELIEGYPLKRYQFLAIEEQPPCANVVYELDVLAKKYGRDEYRAALLKYAEAVERDEWPAYPETRGLIGLPEYLLDDIDSDAEETMKFDGEE